jgi:hypothetical protein
VKEAGYMRRQSVFCRAAIVCMRWNVFDKTADFYYQLWSAKNRHSNAGEKG